MGIKGEWIRYGEGSGYLAYPARATLPLPGVIVIQEIGGVNDNIEDITRRIASAGYAALAPDLFAVNGERPAALGKERIAEVMGFMASLPPGTMMDPAGREAALAKLDEPRRARIGETFGQVFSFVGPGRLQALVPPLVLALRHLRKERAETRGRKVACVGFCMGGGLSALLACEEAALPGAELSGAAIFYGMAPPAEKIARIECPLIAFYGQKDQRVNAGIADFEAAMRSAGKELEYRIYEGAGHAFFNDDAPSYDVEAARDSFARLLSFFSRTLSA